MPWIGPAGSFTPLHHDLTNNFLCQLVGRKHVKLVPPSETPKLYNDRHVFSAVGDLDAADLASRFPLAASARFYDLVLQPGEILFIPVGWWHQVRALDFSVSMTCTNFIWPNDAHGSFPAD
jgi:ribosomal protein L16 Arg81 hydroxylase